MCGDFEFGGVTLLAVPLAYESPKSQIQLAVG